MESALEGDVDGNSTPSARASAALAPQVELYPLCILGAWGSDMCDLAAFLEDKIPIVGVSQE